MLTYIVKHIGKHIVKHIGHTVTIVIVAASFFVAESVAIDSSETIPFAAEVVQDATPIHSGPGGSFYETNKLPRGARVEVYRRDDSGWLAIRPIESSFSWIRSSQIRTTSDPTIAEVTENSAKSWIGSNQSNTNGFHYQVVLAVGEQVEIMGKRTLPSNTGVLETWYKIAPPAGEFRWIHPGHVRLIEENTTSIARASNELKFQRQSEHEATQANRVSRPTTLTGFYEVGQETRTRLENTNQRVHSSALQSLDRREVFESCGDNNRHESRDRDVSLAGDSQFQEPQKLPVQITQQAEKVGASPTQIQVRPLTGDFEQHLRQVDARLSLMVAKDASQWRFNDLRLQLAKLIQTGETPLQRGRARLLLEKLEEFASHAIRRNEVASNRNLKTAAVERKQPLIAQVDPFDSDPAPVRQIAFETSAFETSSLETSALETSAAVGTGIVNPAKDADDTSVSVLKSVSDSTTNKKQIVDETTYDGKGWLMPVYSRAGDAPRFALTDKNAKVLSFVTPAPGYNLHRYLKTRVGIYGQRSFLKEANTPHITAHRVIDLDRHAR